MKYLILSTLILFFSVRTDAQALPISIDGYFSDWTTQAQTHYDAEGDASGVDFLSVSISNDANYLYIKLELADEILLNDNNSIRIQIDTDNNPETGYSINGIGSELGWFFGNRFGYFTTPSGSSVSVYQNNISFLALPTVSSSVFEMAISRHATISGHPLFPENTIKLFLYDAQTGGDYIPDAGEHITYTFDDAADINYPEPISFTRQNSTDIRVMTFNVEHDGITDASRQNAFKRILQASIPDIITFNEAWDSQDYQVQNLLQSWIPVAGRSWQCVEADVGNITCASFPIIDTYRILPGHRITAALIELPAEYGTNFLSVNAHFKCCGGSSNNAIRQTEADAFAAFIRDVKKDGSNFPLPENTPIVLSGDLNLVGNRQQLITILEGDIQNTDEFGQGELPDWDGSTLTDLVSRHSDGQHAYTWREPSSSYWPGRIDYIIYTDAVLKVNKQFIIDTEKMSADRLSSYGLQELDAKATDHLAIVADFEILNTSDNADITRDKNFFLVYNDDSVSGSFVVKSNNYSAINTVKIYDTQGKFIFEKTINSNMAHINLQAYSKGLYFFQINKGDYTETQKVIYQ